MIVDDDSIIRICNLFVTFAWAKIERLPRLESRAGRPGARGLLTNRLAVVLTVHQPTDLQVEAPRVNLILLHPCSVGCFIP